MPSRPSLNIERGILAAEGLRANAFKNTDFFFAVTVEQMINNASTMLNQIMTDFDGFSEAYGESVRGSRRTFAAAHTRAAEQARAAMIRRFDETDEKRTAYRTDPKDARLRRYAGGRLRSAISDPDFFQISYNSIGVGDIEKLNKEAPQWARLNFGAGAAAESGSRAVQGGGASGYASNFTRYFQAGATTVLSKPGPRPAFSIPRGFWFEGHKFYPYSRSIAAAARTGQSPESASDASAVGASGIYSHYSGRGSAAPVVGSAVFQRRRETRGIKAHRFIDAGIFQLFTSLGNEYQRIVDGWRSQAEKGRGPFTRV